jgi:hypothetical protein
MASVTLSTFSGVHAVATGAGGFFFIIVHLAWKDVTHLKMVLQFGMLSWCPTLKRQRKSHWVSIMIHHFLRNCRMRTHDSLMSTVAWHQLKWQVLTSLIAPYPSLYPLYLLRNINFKNICFPWRTLYLLNFQFLLCLMFEPSGMDILVSRQVFCILSCNTIWGWFLVIVQSVISSISQIIVVLLTFMTLLGTCT